MLIIKLGGNMRSLNGYRYLVIGMFFIVLLVGSFLGCKFIIKSSKSDEIIKDVMPVVNKDENTNNNVNIYDKNDRDVEVIYEDFYTICGETIRENTIYYSTNVNKVKEEEIVKQNKENKKYSIAEETSQRIVFKRTVEENCPNHFKIILEDNKINIYNRIDENKLNAYKSINVTKELIREELKERLDEGIDVDSKEELNFIIEDIES